MDGRAADPCGQRLPDRVTLIAIVDADTDLDQFVRRECPVDFGSELGGHARMPDPHHRLERMCAGFQLRTFT